MPWNTRGGRRACIFHTCLISILVVWEACSEGFLAWPAAPFPPSSSLMGCLHFPSLPLPRTSSVRPLATILGELKERKKKKQQNRSGLKLGASQLKRSTCLQVSAHACCTDTGGFAHMYCAMCVHSHTVLHFSASPILFHPPHSAECPFTSALRPCPPWAIDHSPHKSEQRGLRSIFTVPPVQRLSKKRIW